MSPEIRRYRSDDPDDPWFRVGTVYVNSTTLLTGILVVMMFVVTISRSAYYNIALFPDAVLAGRVWQILTWPFANIVGLFTMLSIFFFWYFSRELERELGRFRILRFYLWLTVLLGLLALGLGFVFGGFPWLVGFSSIQTIVLLLFIAERPGVQFFFGIPGWVIAAIILVLNLFGALSQGLPFVVHFLVGLVIGALVAKAFGLLSMYDAVPNLGRRGPRKPKRPKAQPQTRGAVKQGPWAGTPAPPADPRKAAAQTRLDALLDKISATGMDSLTAKERDELVALRNQLRG